ncbi:MAG TPA: bifunctional DNA-formamidopyrimidine glycosylase/DNA-(apurinic or apyrimidinic site) lyase, partial [Verrucomicrobiales bacterium]|nr:bifunctional DNA-formamidopyrimidine glycosylase/DNA-(apurinic or apyrimidinic site) lyase [Verrucomicrobiales bacterium]
MPELPEVEILVRHLDPVLRGRTIRNVTVHRAKSV